MSSNIAEITGKMPFSGKSIVKYWYQKGREASRNGEMGGKVAYAAALGAFAVMHAVQLKMGVTELVRDGSQGPVNVGIDALYTTANAMATYTQAYLATRVLATPTEAQRFALSSADGLSADGAASRDRPCITLDNPSPVDLIVTIGGQVAFLMTMH